MVHLLPPLHSQLDSMYTINSHGYRSAEFATESFDSIWLFGCSYAFGWALAEQSTISSQLSSMLHEPVINLAQGGSSIRYQCDQLALLLSQGLRPQRVCVVWPCVSRWPWYGSLGADQPRLSQDLYLAHSADPVYMSARARKDITEFRLMCELVGAPLAELTWSSSVQESISGPLGFESGIEWSFPEFDLAQDLLHPGPVSNRLACEEFVLQWLHQQQANNQSQPKTIQTHCK